MLNLTLESKIPLEMIESRPYSKMAFDGAYFYCCTGKSRKLYKFSQSGEFICDYDTKRLVSSLCFDFSENCFWAISANSRGAIYKLDTNLCEIEATYIPCYGEQYRDISYSSALDALFLCGVKSVVKLQRDGTLSPVYNSDIRTEFGGTSPIGRDVLIVCSYQHGCPDIVGSLPELGDFDYLTCSPKGFSISSLCGAGGSFATALATQSYKSSYLVRYHIEGQRCGEEQEFPQVHPCHNADFSVCETCVHFDGETRECRFPDPLC